MSTTQKKKSIAHIKELPAWFNIENYAKTHLLGAQEWGTELSARAKLREKSRYPDSRKEDNWQWIQQHVLIYHSYAESENYQSLINAKKMLPAVKINTCGEPLTVKTMTNLTAYSLLFTDENREEIEERMADFYSIKKSTRPLPDNGKWIGKEYKQNSWVNFFRYWDTYLEIDLRASDEQLIRDFTAWLALRRKREQSQLPKKNFTLVDFASWCEAAILPYLDLTFWAELANVRIHQHVIAQAIFPRAYALGSDVDPMGKLKTTKKKAEYLLIPDVITALENQSNPFGVPGENQN